MKKRLLLLLNLTYLVFVSCSELLNPKTPEKEIPESVELSLNGDIYPNRVFLTWTQPTGENFASYELYYDTVPNVGESSILATKIMLKNDTSYAVDKLEQMTTYYFKLFVYNSDTFSASSELTVSTPQCTCGVFIYIAESNMVLIPAGCFFDIDTTAAVLSHSFFMDTTEVTEDEWDRYMGEDTATSQKPITNVSWYQIIIFCNAKSKALGYDTCYKYSEIIESGGDISELIGLVCDFTANGFRLPTEDEWEYAYRAGAFTDFFWGKNITSTDSSTYPSTAEDTAEIDSYAWWRHNDNSGLIKEVAQKKPNPWHLYDMAGNIEEMVWNYYSDDRPAFSRFDYTGLNDGITRIVRGGTFKQGLSEINAYNRSDTNPGDTFFNKEKGFRTVRTKVQ